MSRESTKSVAVSLISIAVFMAPEAGHCDLDHIVTRSFRADARANILSRSAERDDGRASAKMASRTLDLANLERTVRYRPLIEHYSHLNGVDPELVAAIIYAESGGDPKAVSTQGAAGLMQLMPATAAELGVTDRHDAEQNISSGTRYLGQLMDRFGSMELALWAYNAGPGAVKAGRMPSQTRRYVPQALQVKRVLVLC